MADETVKMWMQISCSRWRVWVALPVGFSFHGDAVFRLLGETDCSDNYGSDRKASEALIDTSHLKFLNLTRRTEIGANSYYLEIGGHRLVLDCGMHPKNTGEDALPEFEGNRRPGDRSDPDFARASRSHRHVAGGNAALSRRARFHDRGYGRGWQYAFAQLSQRDDPATRGDRRDVVPAFSHIAKPTERQNAGGGVRCVNEFPLPANGRLNAKQDALTFEFFEAGHVLGSAGILLRAEGQTVFYTRRRQFRRSNNHASGNLP